MFAADSRSAELLQSVHPDLVKIANAAAQEPQPWVVVYGIRTEAEEAKAVATGHSTTMHSRHLSNKDGVACAFDVAALIDGEISWAPGKEEQVFRMIAQQIEAAAAFLGIPINWGGDWVSFKDWGHFELPWSKYP